MKTTIVIAHPWEGSYNRAILNEVTKNVSDYYLIDLYQDGFDPVLSEQDLAIYNEGKSNDPLVAKYNKILDDTDRIIFIFPIWWYDMPAILKGFFDKVLLVNSAFCADDKGLTAIRHIQETYVFTTSFATTDDLINKFGNPINGIWINATFEMVGFHNAKWFNLGTIESSTEEERKAFLDKIKTILYYETISKSPDIF